jgi:hypothetical protein
MEFLKQGMGAIVRFAHEVANVSSAEMTGSRGTSIAVGKKGASHLI